MMRYWPGFEPTEQDLRSRMAYPLFGIECGPGWERLLAPVFGAILVWNTEHPDQPITIDQVKEKYGCYDEQTDVLTRAGWKPWATVTIDDEFAGLREGFLVYDPASEIIKEFYSGKMYTLRTRGIDLCVTPNHRLWCAKGSLTGGGYENNTKEFPLEFQTPEVLFGQNKRFQKSAQWVGKEQTAFTLPAIEWDASIKPKATRPYRPLGYTRTYRRACKIFPMEDWLAFLGWFVAEGCVGASPEVAIACCNTDEGQERGTQEEIYAALGLDYAVCMEQRSALVFKFYDTQLARWLREHCYQGAHAYGKRAPQFIKELSPRQILIFLDALYSGDGGWTSASRILTTVSPRLSDDVQELLFRAGFTSCVKVRPPHKGKPPWNISGNYPVFSITWLRKSNDHSTADKGFAPSSREEWIDYNGFVYCATVPTGLLYVRRGGKAVWCGNSLRFYTSGGPAWETPELARFEDLVNEAEHLSAITCEECGRTAQSSYEHGWWVTLCSPHLEEYRAAH